MMTARARPGDDGSVWDLCVVLYLVAPLLVFAFWWQPLVATLMLAALGLGLLPVCVALRPSRPRAATWLAAGGLFALAGLWSVALGLGHLTYANEDWLIRDAVMHDLASQAWPVRYVDDHQRHWMLRAPLGYYLVPAAASRALALSAHAADGLLAAWAALGAGLFLCGVLQRGRSRLAMCVGLLALMGFGGLDLIGFIVKRGFGPDLGEHLEWWARFAQYSSQSTLLAWVPNHALPAWLGILLIWRHWRAPALWVLAGPLVAASVLWSPLATVGLVPFLLFGLDWRDAPALLLRRLVLALPWAVPALCAAGYVTDGSQAVPGGLAWSEGRFGPFIGRWLGFVLLEFGLLVLLLRRLRPQPLIFHVAVAVLCALPFLRFGPGNDLVMRASIPALTVLALSAVQVFTDASRPWGGVRIAAAVVLVIGLVGSAQELYRSLTRPAWPPAGLGLLDVVRQIDHGVLPPHYAVPVDSSRSVRWMRAPADSAAVDR